MANDVTSDIFSYMAPNIVTYYIYVVLQLHNIVRPSDSLLVIFVEGIGNFLPHTAIFKRSHMYVEEEGKYDRGRSLLLVVV